MRKVLVLTLVAVLLVLAACGPKTPAHEVKGTLKVGVPSFQGHFVPGFGNSSYDNWVRKLIYEHGTWGLAPDGEFFLNETVVKKLDVVENADGSKTYTYTIHEDLKFSDGHPIKAEDFVFGILWFASPQWRAQQASSSAGDGLLGYRAYKFGTDNVTAERFAGVKLLGDYQYSLTIDAEELPYFYEFTYTSYGPWPMHVYAGEGATIDSNDSGAKITGVDMAARTAEIASVERWAPTIASGPYQFVSFENNAVTLKVNEHFKGNAFGEKPKLENVIVMVVPSATEVDLVINGTIDMVTGVIEGEKINAAKSDANTSYNNYPRNGYGVISFACDFGPTKDAKVRRAIGHLLDREEFIQNVAGGYGVTTNGHYGLAQWMYQARKSEIDKIPNLVLNYATANDLLDQTEWKFEADGTTPFDRTKATAGSNYFRHNAAGKVLQINHFGTSGLSTTDNIEIQFTASMPLAGIKFTMTSGDFSVLLDHYYYSYNLKEEERVYHSFNLGSSFGAAYDPYYSFHSDWLGTWYNANQISDPVLDDYMVRMRRTEPGNNEQYLAYWVAYQFRWAELLPGLPLYSNDYHDIFGSHVKGVETTPFLDWADIICKIYIEN